MRRLLSALVVAVGSLVGLTQQVGPPALPRVDRNACPFECCQFGGWTANRKVAVYSDWRRPRRVLFEVQKGQVVTALTGVHVTYKPGHLRALKDMPELHVKAGDTVLTYMYHGEGYFDFWANGHSGNDQIYTALKCEQWANRADWYKDEPFCIVDDGTKEWWIQIKTSSGQTGWAEGNIGFDGTDKCA